MDNEPIIKSLSLKGFRSIAAERIDLDNPTFLVGRNGTGKSNVVDAFAFLAEAMESPLSTVLGRRGGLPAVCHRFGANGVGIELTFGPLGEEIEGGRYELEIVSREPLGAYEVISEHCQVLTRSGVRSFDREESGAFSSTESVHPIIQKTSLVMPVLGGIRSFAPVSHLLSDMRVFSIEPAKIRQCKTIPGGGPSLSSDGANAASVLWEIEQAAPESLVRIDEFLSAILPNETHVRARKYGDTLLLEFSQQVGDRRSNFEAGNMSDGTLRLLALLVAVLQRPMPSLVVFEEPEATVHPGALGAILDVIRLAGRNTQVVVTTHSPDLLDSAPWIENRHLRVVTLEDGATRVRTIEPASRVALEEHLVGAGELLRSNLLEPAAPAKAHAA